jgi:transposase
MEEGLAGPVGGVGSTGPDPAEAGPVLKPAVVEEVLRRLAQHEKVVHLAQAFGVDPKTIRAWRDKGRYLPRAARQRRSILAPHAEWLSARAPEVAFNSAVLYRELVTHFGYTGSVQQVLRFVRPLRVAARASQATVRFETPPGQQAQVDFGQARVWIADAAVVAHVFVCTLAYSRRCYAEAFAHERLAAVLAGHEHAFQHFGGVPAQLVVDNAKPVVLRHLAAEEPRRHQVVWHPVYADFAAYYGFTPWAHWPYRPQSKGKVESGVKYVQRNALAGKRFRSWEHLNAWLLEWAVTVADQRVHGTTHAIPAARFAEEALTPLGTRRVYSRERVRHRLVAMDSLVSIGGSRYSVPARYAGASVVIRELLGSYEILHDGQVIARHAAVGRHQVVMEPSHYRGLLRPGGARAARVPPEPPRFDPGYPASATVAVRDLAVYAAVVEEVSA